MSVQNAFKKNVFTQKTINVEMNLNHARSLWGFIKVCLEDQQKKGEFLMSEESAVKVIGAWESLAKAIDTEDKFPSVDAYGTVTVNAESKEIEE